MNSRRAPPTLPLSIALALALPAPFAMAQDAVRGESLYRALPGQPGVGSCFSCHGEAVNNRNSVLRGAASGEQISRTIVAVAAMGYLRQYLADADLADISAYLATIVPAGPLEALPELLPTTDHFGAQQVGTASALRSVLVRNRQPGADISIGAVLSSDPAQFSIQHDCPLALPPNAQCRIQIAFRPAAPGPVSAAFTLTDSGGRTLRSGMVSGTGSVDAAPTLTWAARPDFAFGQVTIGQAAQRSARLLNASSVAVTVSRLRVTGPNASRFTLAADCAPSGRLEAGAGCDVQMRFAPATAGLVEAWIEIEADASNAPLATVSATAVAAPIAEPPPPPPPPAPAPAPAPAGSATGSGGGASSPLWLAALFAAAFALRSSRPKR